MEKRVSRTEMLFSLGFLFMLICAVGAFFYGVKVGSDRTEAKYVPSKHLNANAAVKENAYQQQDLVSFYHTVFLPYREFQNEWQKSVDKLTSGQATDPASTFKELASLAENKYKEVSKADAVSQVSPLLVEAQNSLLKSLKLFSDAAGRQAGNANAVKASVMVTQIEKDAYYQQAVSYSLQAQKAYYTSMVKWSASVDPDLPGDYEAPKLLNLSDWKKLPLIVKNKLMADQLASRSLLADYYPQDLSSKVDLFIHSGQPSVMKVKTVSAVVDLLIGTEAVRAGDFTANKTRLYTKELLPQLPFFIS
jgi:uncharacterized protein (UPF0333 family)